MCSITRREIILGKDSFFSFTGAISPAKEFKAFLHRPPYANFLKHLRQSAELIKHLTDLKILQNSLFLDETTVLLDSTKVEINKHIKRQVKSHRYFPAGNLPAGIRRQVSFMVLSSPP